MRSVVLSCGCVATRDDDGGGSVDACADHAGDVAAVGRALAEVLPEFTPEQADGLAALIMARED